MSLVPKPDGQNNNTGQQIDAKLIDDIIQSNQNLTGELRGIFVDGHEVRGIEAGGWGSLAKLQVDKITREIKSAERVPTKQDALFAAHYIDYLEKQFQQINQHEDIE